MNVNFEAIEKAWFKPKNRTYWQNKCFERSCEVKLLKEKINTLKSNFEVEIDDCENYKKWYRDYKSRCEKANEWIDKHTEIYTKNGISIIDWDNLSDPRKLKNILNGSDEK